MTLISEIIKNQFHGLPVLSETVLFESKLPKLTRHQLFRYFQDWFRNKFGVGLG
jgi:hypothetical protein